MSNVAIRTLANGLNDNLGPKDNTYSWWVTLHGQVVEISEWADSHPHKDINLLGLDLFYLLKLNIFIDIYGKNLIASNNINIS
jgi:hypothetical protein